MDRACSPQRPSSTSLPTHISTPQTPPFSLDRRAPLSSYRLWTGLPDPCPPPTVFPFFFLTTFRKFSPPLYTPSRSLFGDRDSFYPTFPFYSSSPGLSSPLRSLAGAPFSPTPGRPVFLGPVPGPLFHCRCSLHTSSGFFFGNPPTICPAAGPLKPPPLFPPVFLNFFAFPRHPATLHPPIYFDFFHRVRLSWDSLVAVVSFPILSRPFFTAFRRSVVVECRHLF